MATVTFINAASTTGGSTFESASFTPTAGSLLLVFGSGLTTVIDAGLTSSLGDTFSKFKTVPFGTSDIHRAWAWVADQVSTASPQTLTLVCTGDAFTAAGLVIWEVTGLSRVGLDAILKSASDFGAGGTPAPTFPGNVLTGNPTAGGHFQSNNTAITHPSGWNEDFDAGGSGRRLEAVSRNSGFTGTTVTWDGAATGSWATIMAELDTSSSGTIEEADGSASGTGAASGVGASTAAAAGSSSGTGAAAGVGASAAASAGSSAGTGTASGVGSSAAASAGSAAGAGAASSEGASIATAAGSASGTSTATAVGSADGVQSADGSASGTGVATGVGASVAAAVGAASGSGAALAAGTGIKRSVGSATGSGAASAVGASASAAVGAVIGAGAAAAIGAAIWAAIGSAVGVGSASAVGEQAGVDPTKARPRSAKTPASARSAKTPASPRP